MQTAFTFSCSNDNQCRKMPIVTVHQWHAAGVEHVNLPVKLLQLLLELGSLKTQGAAHHPPLRRPKDRLSRLSLGACIGRKRVPRPRHAHRMRPRITLQSCGGCGTGLERYGMRYGGGCGIAC